MNTESVKPGNIKSVTAITEVLGEGQKVAAIAVEYDKDIDNSKLAESTFSVKGRTVTGVYANNAAARAAQGANGRYAIIELSRKDKDAVLIIESTKDTPMGKKEINVSVTQTREVFTTDGKKYPPDSHAIINDKVVNPVVDDFSRLEFKDPKTGETLKYNLFIPKNYDRNKSYPLVVFISDRGSNGESYEMPLIQGIGGVIWATASEQAKHPCFVLVPQYPCQIVFDDFTTTAHVGMTVDLINYIANQYNIDKNRIYTTGQSQGCMTSIEMGIRYPEMFAGMLLVAGQWDTSRVPVLVHNNIWIVVSEGDPKAFPGMNDITASLEAAGAKISRATWDGHASPEEFTANAKKMITEGNNIKYTVIRLDKVIPADLVQDRIKHHTYTWQVVYNIEALRDWLFSQVKPPRP